MSVPEALNHIGVIDFLDADLRPTFILKAPSYGQLAAVSPVPSYINPSLSQSPAYLNDVCLFLATDNAVEVIRPGRDTINDDGTMKSRPTSITISGRSWQIITLGGCWKIISVAEHLVSTPEVIILDSSMPLEVPIRPVPTLTAKSNSFLRSPKKEEPGLPLGAGDPQSWQWTQKKSLFPLTQHQEVLLSVDWAKTPLGPIQSWPSQLRQICNYILAGQSDSRSEVIFCKLELICCRLETYVAVVGSEQHQHLQRKLYRGRWRETSQYAWPTHQRLLA